MMRHPRVFRRRFGPNICLYSSQDVRSKTLIPSSCELAIAPWMPGFWLSLNTKSKSTNHLIDRDCYLSHIAGLIVFSLLYLYRYIYGDGKWPWFAIHMLLVWYCWAICSTDSDEKTYMVVMNRCKWYLSWYCWAICFFSRYRMVMEKHTTWWPWFDIYGICLILLGYLFSFPCLPMVRWKNI
jgi:hypothetical protein